MKKRIVFLVNPKSGIKKKDAIVQKIHQQIRKDLFEVDIQYTHYQGHGRELSTKAVEEKIDAVVVVGGDGTINEAASALVYTDTALGIIPGGSGNGLARHLHIPLKPAKSLEVINTFRRQKIDTFQLNGLFGCNLAGVGFDASVAIDFNQLKRRGFWSYLKIILKLYSGYRTFGFANQADGEITRPQTLLLCFANSGQFGNNAVIAPRAVINDGFIDVCFVKKAPLWQSPFLGYKLLSKTIHETSLVEYEKVKEMTVFFEKEIPFHIDGDPVGSAKKMHIQVNPLSLNVIF